MDVNRKNSAPVQGDLFNPPEPKKVTVNTLQLTAHVERLCVNKVTREDIYSYDDDNLYPNKVRSIWQRSPSARSASTVYAEFIAGEGTQFNDAELVDAYGNLMTFWDIIRFGCAEISIFDGFAFHINYNQLGEKTSFTLIPFEMCRVSLDQNFIYVKKDWSNFWKDKEKQKYYIFNDDSEVVRQQIEESGGIDKYPGQVMYFKNTVRSIYTTAKCDAVLDDMQLEHEIGVYNLMNIQNNYPLSSIIKVSKAFDQKSILETQMNLNRAKGAKNAGKAIIVEVPPSIDGKEHKMIENLGRENIDSLFKYQKESARDDIFAAYNQPQILSGLAKSGMFNQDQFSDAFEYYNSKTEIARKDLEKKLKILFRNNTFGIPDDFELIPKTYIRNDRKPIVDNIAD